MAIYAFIFARGGSKGVPGKNVKPMAGKPLIAYSIELALKHKDIREVFVSTDDTEIADAALKYGAKVISRPMELAQDKSPEWLAWQHAIDHVKSNFSLKDDSIFISLPATSPLRNMTDISNALAKFKQSGAEVTIGVSESNRSPYFNMVKENQTGTLSIVNEGQVFSRRQDVPQVYDITTVAYVSSFNFVLQNNGLFDGKVSGFFVPPERAIDIDTPLDFKIAEFLMQERLQNEVT